MTEHIFPGNVYVQDSGKVRLRIRLAGDDLMADTGLLDSVMDITSNHLDIRNPANYTQASLSRRSDGGFLKLYGEATKGSVILAGSTGDLDMYDQDGNRSLAIRGKVGSLGGITGMWIGAHKDDLGPKAGYIAITDVTGNDSITLDGKFQNISLSNRRITLQGHNSTIWLNDDAGTGSIIVDGANRSLTLQNRVGIQTIQLDGNSGDIILNNADCAEDFDVSKPGEINPGTVMVIEEGEKLRQSKQAYDKKVAGVISGAGDCKPGILLDKKHSQVNRKAVALMGKVYCKVDAQSSPIEVGDLLTTSSTPGHAMKAADPLKAFGAVIGKALRPLKTGKGMMPILVALQ